MCEESTWSPTATLALCLMIAFPTGFEIVKEGPGAGMYLSRSHRHVVSLIVGIQIRCVYLGYHGGQTARHW